jgi:hypothetical protein
MWPRRNRSIQTIQEAIDALPEHSMPIVLIRSKKVFIKRSLVNNKFYRLSVEDKSQCKLFLHNREIAGAGDHPTTGV